MLTENLLAGNWDATTPWNLGTSGSGGPYFPPTGFVWLYAIDRNASGTPILLRHFHGLSLHRTTVLLLLRIIPGA